MEAFCCSGNLPSKEPQTFHGDPLVRLREPRCCHLEQGSWAVAVSRLARIGLALQSGPFLGDIVMKLEQSQLTRRTIVFHLVFKKNGKGPCLLWSLPRTSLVPKELRGIKRAKSLNSWVLQPMTFKKKKVFICCFKHTHTHTRL